MDAEMLLDCALDIGEQMLMSGAEISRVEDTIERICRAYGAVRIDVFTITSCIIATLKLTEDGRPTTQTRRIRSSTNDMNKLDKLNTLSRAICNERPSCEEIRRRFRGVTSSHPYPIWGQYLNYALVASTFSVFFGGSVADALVSAAIGMILKYLTSLCTRYGMNTFFNNVLCSLAGGCIAMLAIRLGIGHSFDKIAIGDIMLLIPGALFTNSLRDMIGGDTVSGIMRLFNALMGAVAIALGFAVAGGMLS